MNIPTEFLYFIYQVFGPLFAWVGVVVAGFVMAALFSAMLIEVISGKGGWNQQ
jgi:hypothetical protein